MKVLITGSNGFIGRNIVSSVIEDSFSEVILTDIQSENVSNNHCQYYSANIGDNNFCEFFLECVPKIDLIIHVAAALNTDNDNIDNIKSNCIGIQNVSKYARQSGCSKFIFISGVTVIGEPIVFPITEEHLVNPLSTYHLTKYFGEQFLNMPFNKSLNPIILRLTAPVGRGLNKNKILPVFLDCCRNNRDILLHGEGLRIQNYIDVRDICQAVLLACHRECIGIYNIASKKSYTNLELAKLCIEITGSSSKIIFSGIKDPQENFKWEISIEKAKKNLGYLPAYSIIETIKKMV